MKLPVSVVDSGFINLGTCVVGPNLNSLAIRGFSSALSLSLVSGPDTFDQFENPEGTQRSLAAKHAREAGRYATDSIRGDHAKEIRAFPEVILNARDSSVLEFRSTSTNRVLSWSSLSKSAFRQPQVCNLRIRVSALNFPIPPYEPQISRIDGNHRLHQMMAIFLDGLLPANEFPIIPFALYVGLTKWEETKLFVDINRNHKGMSTNLIITMGQNLAGQSARDAVGDKAEYLAVKLAARPIFQGLVDLGSSRSSFVSNMDALPPLSLTLLRACIRLIMQRTPVLAIRFRAEPDRYLDFVETYFLAVQHVFPEMWGNKNDYIISRSIGMFAFAQLGGHLLQVFENADNVSINDFIPALSKIALRVNLSSSQWAGYAGAAGGRVVFEKCLIAIEGK